MMKNNTRYFLLAGFASGLVMVIVSVGWFTTVQSQTESPSKSVNPPAQETQSRASQSVNKQKPTPVQRGVMTERQKAHSKLFDVNPGRKKLTANEGQSPEPDGVWVKQGPGLPELPYPGGSNSGAVIQPQGDNGPTLQELVTKADLILVGVVQDKSSQLTKSETAIFTDYDISVEKVLKDSSGTSSQPRPNIVFTHLGGAVLFEGRILSFTPPDELILQQGSHYLLFLNLIPSTRAYQLSNDYGAFHLARGQMLPAARGAFLPTMLRDKKDAQSLIKEILGITSGNPAIGGGK
jgi:hypothetical protein